MAIANLARSETMKRIILSILCLSVLSSVAFAQVPRCRPRAEMVEWLGTSKFFESRFATGSVTKDRIVEFFKNAEKGTWTVIVTTISRIVDGEVQGESCILAGGGNYEDEEYIQLKPEKKAFLNLHFYALQ